MIIKVTTFDKDGKAVVVEREVADDYFDTNEPESEPTDTEVLNVLLGVEE